MVASGHASGLKKARRGARILKRRPLIVARPLNTASASRDRTGAGVYRNTLYASRPSRRSCGACPSPPEPLVPGIQEARGTLAVGAHSAVADPTGDLPSA